MLKKNQNKKSYFNHVKKAKILRKISVTLTLNAKLKIWMLEKDCLVRITSRQLMSELENLCTHSI